MIPSGKNSVEIIVELSSIPTKIDFHTHTDSSDGALSAEELIEKARQAGITTLGICDHDTVSGLDTAVSIASKKGLTVVPGIEITSSYKRFQLHFLGYFFDYTDKKFLSRLGELQDARVRRAKRIIAKLNRIKIPLTFESVIERVGGHLSVGRPHIANTMVEEGYAQTYDEVFHKYIGIGRPAYEANYPFPPAEAIGMVSAAGGLAFLAHPSHYVNEDLLMRLMKDGLQGIEVVHPSHSEEEIAYYNRFANENSLLKSGGSDFHGGLKNDDGNLGKYVIPVEWFNEMRDKLGK
jgi:3',5'-nucleoside bisphosphate phosphatase